MEWPPDLALYPAYWHQRLKKGFGLGFGDTYQPWLRVRDVPSVGTSANPQGIKSNRKYHLLSTYERTYFHIMERKCDVVGIQEQFPILDLKGTLEICAELGVQHSRKGRFPEPFTLDFLIFRRTGNKLRPVARSIKTPEHALDPEIRLRLKVESLWCERNGLDWKLVDTAKFSKEMLDTLVFIRGWFRHRHQPDLQKTMIFKQRFDKFYSRNAPLREILEAVARSLALPYKYCENEFRFCAWSDVIKIDITSLVALHLPVTLQHE